MTEMFAEGALFSVRFTGLNKEHFLENCREIKRWMEDNGIDSVHQEHDFEYGSSEYETRVSVSNLDDFDKLWNSNLFS